MKNIDEQISKIKRGCIELISEEELRDKIKKKGILRVKFGADPTAPDLHLGHTVILRKLRQFQDLGHIVIFIIGDFTARIGDPSGRNTTRPPLSKEQIEENARTYKEQIFKILDPERTELVYNSQWFERMNFSDVLKLAAKYTVARMLERDDFSKRYKENRPIGIHEFLYPLMQGYDSVEIEADIELGGNDQKFNLLVGRELQREYGQEPQCILTMPILEGLDGTQKMSKSYGNYVGITEPANEMFGKIMSIPDELMWKYYLLLTDVPEQDIEEMKKNTDAGNKNPMEYKKDLAQLIVEQYWDVESALNARAQFEKVFSKREIPDDIPVINFSEITENRLVRVVADFGLAPSSSEAKRLIRQGAVEINGTKEQDINFAFSSDNEYVLKVGKRRFLKILPLEKNKK